MSDCGSRQEVVERDLLAYLRIAAAQSPAEAVKTLEAARRLLLTEPPDSRRALLQSRLEQVLSVQRARAVVPGLGPLDPAPPAAVSAGLMDAATDAVFGRPLGEGRRGWALRPARNARRVAGHTTYIVDALSVDQFELAATRLQVRVRDDGKLGTIVTAREGVEGPPVRVDPEGAEAAASAAALSTATLEVCRRSLRWDTERAAAALKVVAVAGQVPVVARKLPLSELIDVARRLNHRIAMPRPGDNSKTLTVFPDDAAALVYAARTAVGWLSGPEPR